MSKNTNDTALRPFSVSDFAAFAGADSPTPEIAYVGNLVFVLNISEDGSQLDIISNGDEKEAGCFVIVCPKEGTPEDLRALGEAFIVLANALDDAHCLNAGSFVKAQHFALRDEDDKAFGRFATSFHNL